MKVSIPYGFEEVEVEIPDENYAGTYSVKAPPEVDADQIIEDALSNPIGRKLEDIKADSTIIVINDHTRLTPTAKMLDHILPRIRGRIKLIVATGTHRSPTEDELRVILGHYYEELRKDTAIHDSKKSSFRYLGETTRGTPIELNEELFKHDLIVTLGSIEPHYFAGFTGGRKSIAPGVCSYRCVEHNHKMIFDPNSALAKLKGNPVHEDLEEIVRKLSEEKEIFSLNVTITGEGKPFSAAAGDIFKSFYKLVDEVRRYYEVRAPKADVVIAVAPGNMGVDLYQAQKALEPAKFIVKEGGIIILVAPCWSGIGPRNFYDLLAGRTREEVREILRKEFKLGYHKAIKIVETLDRARVFIVTDLDPKIPRDIGFEPFKDIQSAINRAIEESGGKIIILPDASISIPSGQ